MKPRVHRLDVFYIFTIKFSKSLVFPNLYLCLITSQGIIDCNSQQIDKYCSQNKVKALFFTKCCLTPSIVQILITKLYITANYTHLQITLYTEHPIFCKTIKIPLLINILLPANLTLATCIGF